MSVDADPGTCAGAVARDGFCFVDGAILRDWLRAHGSLAGWDAFADSWNQLRPDPYLAQLGRLRRRRYGTWRGGIDGLMQREPHQPHFQPLAYNAIQGDLERWFEPITDAVANSGPMQACLAFAVGFFGSLAPQVRRWRIEVHQFRIEATPETPGEPTPEGVHRDGVDYVLVLMINRHNIASGTTTVHAPGGAKLGAFTLTKALDAALLDDARVHHGVTPVSPVDPLDPAYRDVLVVTLRHEPD